MHTPNPSVNTLEDRAFFLETGNNSPLFLAFSASLDEKTQKDAVTTHARKVPACVGEFLAQAREFLAQAREFLAQAREFKAQARKLLAQAREFLAQARKFLAQAREFLAQAREFLAQARKFLAQARELPAQAGKFKACVVTASFHEIAPVSLARTCNPYPFRSSSISV
jgi:hypothetical protein